MLDKIISGGQTGADRAALDTAIKFNIPHGGWLPKGRKTEDGPLPEHYQLSEMPTADYRERTKKNILESQATVIISQGPLTGGSLLTQTFAKVVGRPCCHIDLVSHDTFEAALIFKSFVRENGTAVLNVAGPRLSHQPDIYFEVRSLMESGLYLIYLETAEDKQMLGFVPEPPYEFGMPGTVREAVALMEPELSLKAKTYIAKLPEAGVQALYFSFLDYTRQRTGMDAGNKVLVKACEAHAVTSDCSVEDAAMVILKRLKQSLEKEYLLRVIK